MNCISCGNEFHSPAGSAVPICSSCLAKNIPLKKDREETESVSPDEKWQNREKLDELFPEFEFLDQVGTGGMGVVFSARQISLDRLVAIKLLNPDTEGEGEFMERFEREAKAMALLDHSNIVRVHDFGNREGIHFLVMEFVDGRNLQEILAAGEMDRARACEIIEQVCSALYYAHRNGVIHRDVKPGNILIGDDGQVKVGDFGLARLVHPDQDIALTLSDVGMGTPHFVAPEQLTDAGKVDGRADIYSLGVLIYLMFTGQMPAGNFPAPTSKFPQRVKNLDDIILQALDPDPRNRCGDVREILQAIQHGFDGKHSPQSNPGRAFRVVLPVLAAIVITALPVSYFLKNRQTKTEPGTSKSVSKTPPPRPELLLPETILPGTPQFEKQRRRGGTLRKWSEMTGMVDISNAGDIDDLIFVTEAPYQAMSWYAARSNGEMLSSHPHYHLRNDYRELNHSFWIEWPDRLRSVAAYENAHMPFLEPVSRAVDITQQKNVAFLLRPDGRIGLAAKNDWVKINNHLIRKLQSLDDFTGVDAQPATFVATRKEDPPLCFADNRGFFDPPEGFGQIIQAEAGGNHIVGLSEKGEVAVWAHPFWLRHSRIPSVLKIPENLPKCIRVMASGFMIAVQHEDGTWTAWGDDQGRGLIDHINSVGVALDFAFFSITPNSGAKCVWIEPAALP